MSSENDQLTQGLIILGKVQIILRVVISSSPLPPKYWKALWAPWREGSWISPATTWDGKWD